MGCTPVHQAHKISNMNDTPNPNQIFSRAKAAHDAGNVTEAEPLYKQLLNIAPGHPDVLHLLGALYGQTGRFDDAIAKVSGDPSYHYNYGNVLLQMKRWDEAATAFGRSLEIAPKNPDAAFNLGLVLKQGGRLDDAEQAFRRVISLNADHADALAELSESLGQTGKLGEAITLQERAITLKPNTANFHFNLGMLFLKSRNWDSALASFNKTLARQRWHVPALAARP
jgi:protein O-GlcNAc transferase